MDTAQIIETLTTKGTEVGLKLLGALALWIVGRWLIGLALRMIHAAMGRSSMDDTLKRYVGTSLNVVLTISLIAAILGYFGVETTTFAALLAAGGVAIGMAWSGLLANFAAGAFLIVLRPIKVGDYVIGGGVEGTVKEIGLFVTKIDTPDQVEVIIGNNKLFSENITNFSSNPIRRVNLVAQLAHGVDPREAIEKLRTNVSKIDNVDGQTGPDIFILEFNLAGPVLCVRPYTHTDHYWQVYFDTNMAIKETFGDAGYPVPENHYHLRKAA